MGRGQRAEKRRSLRAPSQELTVRNKPNFQRCRARRGLSGLERGTNVQNEPDLLAQRNRWGKPRPKRGSSRLGARSTLPAAIAPNKPNSARPASRPGPLGANNAKRTQFRKSFKFAVSSVKQEKSMVESSNFTLYTSAGPSAALSCTNDTQFPGEARWDEAPGTGDEGQMRKTNPICLARPGGPPAPSAGGGCAKRTQFPAGRDTSVFHYAIIPAPSVLCETKPIPPERQATGKYLVEKELWRIEHAKDLRKTKPISAGAPGMDEGRQGHPRRRRRAKACETKPIFAPGPTRWIWNTPPYAGRTPRLWRRTFVWKSPAFVMLERSRRLLNGDTTQRQFSCPDAIVRWLNMTLGTTRAPHAVVAPARFVASFSFARRGC